MNNAIMKKIGVAALSLAIILSFTFTFTSMKAYGNEETQDQAPKCKAAILYEDTSDTVIYDKNKDMKLAPASMTKVMTALVVLDDNPALKGEITVDPRAVKDYYCSWMDINKHLEAGEKISAYECMKFMLVYSANEATTAFAFSMYDDYGDFIKKMNEKAEKLGCENTHFYDSSGLSSSNVTTPADMVKMCREAMKNDKFREIVKSEGGVLPVSNKRSEPTPYKTYLAPMCPQDKVYESPYSKYIVGVKTGWIPASGYCYACCMEKDGYVYYSVVMSGDDIKVNGRWAQGDFIDTINLLKLTDGFEPKMKVAPIVAGIGILILLIGGFIMLKHKRKK